MDIILHGCILFHHTMYPFPYALISLSHHNQISYTGCLQQNFSFSVPESEKSTSGSQHDQALGRPRFLVCMAAFSLCPHTVLPWYVCREKEVFPFLFLERH